MTCADPCGLCSQRSQCPGPCLLASAPQVQTDPTPGALSLLLLLLLLLVVAVVVAAVEAAEGVVLAVGAVAAEVAPASAQARQPAAVQCVARLLGLILEAAEAVAVPDDEQGWRHRARHPAADLAGRSEEAEVAVLDAPRATLRPRPLRPA